jgi:hypothetical protein
MGELLSTPSKFDLFATDSVYLTAGTASKTMPVSPEYTIKS